MLCHSFITNQFLFIQSCVIQQSCENHACIDYAYMSPGPAAQKITQVFFVTGRRYSYFVSIRSLAYLFTKK